MKPPWRPYQKGLKEAIARLMAAPSYRSPVSDTSEIGEWIDCLRFHEMMLGDLDAGALAETLAEGRIARYAPFGSLPRHVFQMVLRCQCALDFCSGVVDKRKTYDWERPPALVFRGLLVEFWRSNAIHWAWKRFPRPPEPPPEVARKMAMIDTLLQRGGRAEMN